MQSKVQHLDVFFHSVAVMCILVFLQFFFSFYWTRHSVISSKIYLAHTNIRAHINFGYSQLDFVVVLLLSSFLVQVLGVSTKHYLPRTVEGIDIGTLI